MVRFSRSAVTWWEAPLSSSQDGGWLELLAAKFARGCHGVTDEDCDPEVAPDFGMGMKRKEGQRFAVCPWSLHI